MMLYLFWYSIDEPGDSGAGVWAGRYAGFTWVNNYSAGWSRQSREVWVRS